MGSSNPYTTSKTTASENNVSTQPYRVLLIGQKLAEGHASSNIITKNIGNAKQENILFGEKSMLANMVRNYKLNNKYTILDCVALDDSIESGKTKAKKSITFVGTSTSKGNIEINIMGTKYMIDVVISDTETNIASDFVALINANTKSMVVASNLAGVITLEHVHYGSIGNDMTIMIKSDIVGVTYSITENILGEKNPIFDIETIIGENRYNLIVCPIEYTDAITQIEIKLTERFSYNNKILWGHCIFGKIDDETNHKPHIDYNSKILNYVALKKINNTNWVGSDVQLPVYSIISQIAGVYSLKLTDGADVSNVVNAGDRPEDIIGGYALCAKPTANMPINISALDNNFTWTLDEIEDLKLKNCIVLHNNDSDNLVILDSFYTTKKTDINGNEDYTYQLQEFVDTSQYAAEYIFLNTKKKYSNVRLGSDGDISQPGVANNTKLKTIIIQFFDILASNDFLILDVNQRKFFVKNLKITSNMLERNFSVVGKLPILSHVGSIDFIWEIAI